MCKKQKYKLVLALGIGVARIFNGGGSKPQITCNDVIRNFRKEKFFVGQRYRRIENQKSRRGLAVTQKFAERKGLKPKVKKQYKASGEKSITIQNSTETGLDSKLTVLFEFKHKGVIYVQFSFDFGDDQKFSLMSKWLGCTFSTNCTVS